MVMGGCWDEELEFARERERSEFARERVRVEEVEMADEVVLTIGVGSRAAMVVVAAAVSQRDERQPSSKLGRLEC